MSSPSRLFNETTLVLDASVLINLLAIEDHQQIIGHLSAILIIEEKVREETNKYREQAVKLEALESKKLIGVQSLTLEGLKRFEDLVADLDDGESSSIAHALTIGSPVCVDDKKATRILRERYPNQKVYSSLDLLGSAKVITNLGEDSVANAIHQALVKARMNVPSHFEEWVRTILGEERLANCTSLKRRR